MIEWCLIGEEMKYERERISDLICKEVLSNTAYLLLEVKLATIYSSLLYETELRTNSATFIDLFQSID